MVGMYSCLYFDWRKLARKPRTSLGGTSLGGLRKFQSENDGGEPDRMDLSSGHELCLHSSLKDSKMCYCFLPFPLALKAQHQGSELEPSLSRRAAEPGQSHPQQRACLAVSEDSV